MKFLERFRPQRLMAEIEPDGRIETTRPGITNKRKEHVLVTGSLPDDVERQWEAALKCRMAQETGCGMGGY